MSDAAEPSTAWAAVLPPGTSWLPRQRAGRRRHMGIQSGVTGPTAAAPGEPLAQAVPPWSLAGSSGSVPAAAGTAGLRSYVAVGSQQAPILISSRDPAVLRYVAGSVLSVPPGAGTAASLIATAGLAALRFRLAWNVLALARQARLVVVRWSG